MNYSNNPAMVRVDFFKESGKWYATEQMEWLHYDGNKLIHDVFIESLHKAFTRPEGGHYYSGMTAVCLQPYHQHEHPLMIHNWNNKQP